MSDAATGADVRSLPDRPVRRGRWVVLLLLAAALVGLVATPTWVVAEGSNALDDSVGVAVAGARVAPQTPAAALVLLAAAAACALVGPVGRWAVAAVTVGAGLLVVGAGLGVLVDPAGAAAGAVADATGVVTADAPATTTAGPVAALVAGAAAVVLGVAVGRVRGTWQVRSRRHERSAVVAEEGPVPGRADERSDWDALSRGDDPS